MSTIQLSVQSASLSPRGMKNKNMVKKELGKIKPSDLLKRDEDTSESSTDNEELDVQNNNVLEI